MKARTRLQHEPLFFKPIQFRRLKVEPCSFIICEEYAIKSPIYPNVMVGARKHLYKITVRLKWPRRAELNNYDDRSC